MKKIILSGLFFSFIALSGIAQDKKVEFAVEGGYAYNMPKGSDNIAAAVNLNGLYLGPTVNLKINESWGVHTGLLYSYFQKVNKYAVVLDNWRQSNTKAQFIDLPVRLQFTYPLADDFSLHLLAGPNLNYGLNKHVNSEIVVNKDIVSSMTVKGDNIFADHNTYSPLDLQFGVGVAVQYYKISVQAGYDWGLLDRNITSSDKFKTNEIKLGIAYTF